MKYIAKKAATMLVTLLVISMLAFLAFEVLPGDPTTKMLGTEWTAERAEVLRHELGLDVPLPLRYLRWLGGFREKPKLVFVNHGDPETADAFTRCLNEEMGYRAYAPYSGAEFDLLSGSFLREPQGVPVEKKSAQGRRVSPAFTRLIAAAERLLAACRRLEGHANKERAGHADRIEKLADRVEKDI